MSDAPITNQDVNNVGNPGAMVTPQPSSVDASGAPLNNPQSPVGQPTAEQPTQQQQTPTQPQKPTVQGNPAQPQPQPTQGHNIFRSLMETLAGPKFEYRINPDGTQQAVRIPQTKSQLANSIVAGALTGMFAGSQTKPGPGQFTRGFGAGGEAGMARRQQIDQQDRQTAQQDFVRKAAVAENNMRTLIQNHQLSRMDQEDIDAAAKGNEASLAYHRENDPESILAEHLSQKDAADIKRFPIGSADRMVDGSKPTLDANGKITGWEPTYAMVKPEAKEPMVDEEGNTVDTIKKSLAYHNPAFPEALYGGKISANTPPIYSSTMHKAAMFNNGVDNLQKELNTFHDKNGWDKVNVPDMIKTDPRMAEAIFQFQRASSGANPDRPDQQLAMMKADPKAAQYAPEIEKLFGTRIEQFKKDMANKDLADKTAAQETARVAAEAKAKAATPEGQLDLKQKQQQITNEGLTAQKSRLEINKLQTDQANENALNSAVHGPVDENGLDNTYLNSLPREAREAVRAYGEGRQILTPQALRTQKGQAMLEMVTNAYPARDGHKGYDATRAESYQKLRNDFTGTGKDAQFIQHMNVALQHLGEVNEHNNFLSTFPGVKTLARKAGFDSPAALNTAKQVVSAEIGKAYQTGVIGIEDKKRYDDLLDTTFGGELRSNVKELAKLITAKINTERESWENGAPPGAVNEVKFVFPEARTAYKNIVGEDLPPERGTTPTEVQRSQQNQPAPEGTVINVNGQQQVKQGGKWVPQGQPQGQ